MTQLFAVYKKHAKTHTGSRRMDEKGYWYDSRKQNQASAATLIADKMHCTIIKSTIKR